MHTEDKDVTPTGVEHSNTADQPNVEANTFKELEALEEDIIRNDTIPETSRENPGSNGAFPVGAFDNSKD